MDLNKANFMFKVAKGYRCIGWMIRVITKYKERSVYILCYTVRSVYHWLIIVLDGCFSIICQENECQGPVVQSNVSLTSSLRRQLVKYMPTTLSNPLLFFVGKM